MGYRIDYRPALEKRRYDRCLLILGFVLFLGINILFHDEKDIFYKKILPENVEAVITSLDSLLGQLKRGEAFADAFQVFCRQVISK